MKKEMSALLIRLRAETLTICMKCMEGDAVSTDTRGNDDQRRMAMQMTGIKISDRRSTNEKERAGSQCRQERFMGVMRGYPRRDGGGLCPTQLVLKTVYYSLHDHKNK